MDKTAPAAPPDAGTGAASARRAAHWRATGRLTMALLAVWFATAFCTVFFARELYRFTLFGWPLSFYMAAQGALLIYLAILVCYAWRMRRLDRRAAAEDGR